MKKFFVVFVLLCVCGCHDWNDVVEDLDVLSFVVFGDSVLDVEMPSQLRSLHLDDEKADGEKVILSGELTMRDKFKTYGVLEDDSGRVLTVFTDLQYGWDVMSEGPKSVEVLGRVETGHGGVRFLRVVALRQMQQVL